MIAALLFALLPIGPSADCYATYAREWCDEHAAELAAARPGFEDLATDNAGGYRPGDPVATTWGGSVAAPTEALVAVNATGASPDEARLLIDLSACEAELQLHAENPSSSASGPWQFLDGTWNRVASATGYSSIGRWEDNATNALWLGRNGGWQHWECFGRVR